MAKIKQQPGKKPQAIKGPAVKQAAKTMTNVQIAAAAQVSRQYVARRLSQGQTPQQIIATAQARREARESAVKEMSTDTRLPGSQATIAQLTRHRMRIDNEMKRLALQEKRQQLLSATQLALWFGNVLFEVRGQLLALPGQLADALGRSDAQGCAVLLDQEVRKLLDLIADFGQKTARESVAPGADAS